MTSEETTERITRFEEMSRLITRGVQLRQSNTLGLDGLAGRLVEFADDLFEDFIEFPREAWSPAAKKGDSIRFFKGDGVASHAELNMNVDFCIAGLKVETHIGLIYEKGVYTYYLDGKPMGSKNTSTDESLTEFFEKFSDRIVELAMDRGKDTK